MKYTQPSSLFNDNRWSQITAVFVLSILLLASLFMPTNANVENEVTITLMHGFKNAPKDYLSPQLSGAFNTVWDSGSSIGTRDLALGDMDGDGDLDLAVANGHFGDRSQIYRNDGNNNFTDVTSGDLLLEEDFAYSIAWGDVDGDGDLDLAIGYQFGKADKIFRNDGQGGFNELQNSGLAADSSSTHDIAVGDLNGDGFLDIIAAKNGVNKIFHNDGNGIFTDQTGASGAISSASSNTLSIALGDLNGDGYLDIVAGNSGQDKIYYNNGTGVFSLLSFTTSSWDTADIAIGDLDNDGWPDIVAGTHDYGYEVANKLYLSDQNGSFTESNVVGPTEETITSALALADLDQDGDLDLITGNGFTDDGTSAPNWIYENDGNAGFTRMTSGPFDDTAQQTTSLTVGDTDNDGDFDIFVGNRSSVNLLYRNDNPVNFITIPSGDLTSNTSLHAVSMAWGDMDGDGDLDLAVNNTIYSNDGQGQFTDVTPINMQNSIGTVYDVAWGDMNNDGRLDLAIGYDGQNQVYRNEGSGIFIDVTNGDLKQAPGSASLAWGDINNDDFLDLIVGKKVYRNDGNGIFTDITNGDLASDDDSTSSIALGDMNGDGLLDIVTGNQFTANKIYLNDGNGTFNKMVGGGDLALDTDDTRSISVGDINGDGQLDILVGNWQEVNKIYLNDGNGAFTLASGGDLSQNSDFTTSTALGDFNGDGLLDIAIGNGSGRSNRVYLNLGNELFANITSGEMFWEENVALYSTETVAWGDKDSDGDLDLVTGGNAGVQLYENFLQNDVASLPTNPPTIHLAGPQTAQANFYASGISINNRIVEIPYIISDVEDNAVGQIIAEYSLNGGGQWLPAVATTNTVTTNLSTSAWPTGTEHIYYWDTFASGFFGQSDNVVFRIEAYPRPAQSSIAGEYQYTNLTPFPIQRPYASATTFPFRVRSTQIQVFEETISPATEAAEAIVFRKTGNSLAELMGDPNNNQIFITDRDGYLSGRGQLDIGDNLFAALPMTTTYRTPPQLIFSGADSLSTVGLHAPPSSAMTAEFWLLPTAEGELFTLGGLTLSNPLDLTINGQSTGVNLGDGFPHHVALTWQDSNNAWNLVVDGESEANGVTDISLDDSLSLGDGYSGSLDEIRLWNTVRSSTQISETLFTSLTGNESGLIGYWPVEESDSGIVNDASGHGNDLSLSGDVTVYYDPLYTVYHTSGAPTPSGVAMFEVTEPGVQQLIVSKDNPLMLFDLDVSLEWDASGDSDYLDRLDKDIKRASEILYDLTNGQVAFGSVNVYQDKELWDEADIQVYVNNNQRPNANLGGIVTNYLTDTLKTGEVVGNAFLPGKIRIGATWNRYGNPGGTVGEDWPRVLAHEFGHYGLFLLDNYLGVEEVDGSKIIVEVDCAGSAMTDAYRQDYSEFLGLLSNSAGHSWLSSGCQNTLAQDTTGRSDWETIHNFYPFLKENIISTQTGPTSLPLAVTQVTIHQPANGQELLTTPVFYINDTAGNLIPFTRGEGQAYLYQSNGTADPEDDDVLYLGSPSGPLINARGATVGDRLCVFDNGHTPPRVGCLDDLQNSGATLTLVDIPLWQPEITVRPVNSTTLAVTVTQASVSNIHVQLFPSYRPTDTIKALTAELVHQGNGVYTGAFQFPITVLDGFIRVWEEGNANHESVSRFANAPGWDGNTFVGFGGNRFIAWGGNRFIAWGGNTFVGFGGNRFIAWGGNRFVGFGGNTFVGFGGNRFVGFGGNTFVGFNAPLASPDGQVILYNVDNILAGNVAASLQVLPSVPDLPTWLTPIGQVYRYTTQENEGDNLVIQFQYLQRELPAVEEDQLRIYYLDESDPAADWQRLENTTIDDFRNLASAKMPSEGLYALIATVELPRFYEGWNLFGYLINENRDVGLALESIDGAYNSVYHYDAATKDWLLYDATVVLDNPEFAPLVNDLVQLETGKGYWLYATEAITAYLGVANGSSLDIANQQFPPATYYGYILPHEGFQPTAGMPVTAWVDGVNCGQGNVESLEGQLAYMVQIQSEDNNGHCGTAGKSVTFQVGEWTMVQQPNWDNSQAQSLTLSTLATTRPVYLPIIMRP